MRSADARAPRPPSLSIARFAHPICRVGIALWWLAVVLVGALPAIGILPPKRFVVGHRFEGAENLRWQGLRVSFYAPLSPPSQPVRLAIHALLFPHGFECGALHNVAELELLAVTEVDLGAQPVIPQNSLWIAMPPKDEVWVHWGFEAPLELDPGKIYLVTVDAVSAETSAGRAVIDFGYVQGAEHASVISLDGGESFTCMDEASALAALGLEHLGEISSLLRIKVVPDLGP